MSEPLVTIVIPVFNGAEHLRECLESVLAQTYSNWRAVVMDNRSTDGTAAIADEFALRDARVRVIHAREFVAKNENYNRAIAHADGEASYIKLLEADNWITADCLEKTVRLAEKDPAIGLVTSFSHSGGSPKRELLANPDQIFSGREAVRQFYRNGPYLFGAPTCMLFRASALREEPVWFRPIGCCDDVDLCLRVLRKWKFGYVRQILAFIRVDETGAFSKVRELNYRPAYMHFSIQAYGEDFFAGRELVEVRSDWERQYFDCLGRAAITGRTKAYWEFHRRMFESAGQKLRARDLVLPATRTLISFGLKPKTTVVKFVKRIKGKRSPEKNTRNLNGNNFARDQVKAESML